MRGAMGVDFQRIASGNSTNNNHKGNKRALYRHGVSVREGLVVGVLPQSLTDPLAAIPCLPCSQPVGCPNANDGIESRVEGGLLIVITSKDGETGTAVRVLGRCEDGTASTDTGC